MVDTPGVTAPKTPPHGVTAASQLKSTPNAVGSAAISEHISTVGTEYVPFCSGHRTRVLTLNNACRVGDVRPWITRDVEDFRECHPDTILQKLLDDCKDTFVPPVEKSKLFEDSLQAVVQLCNDQKIKGHIEGFANCTLENGSYIHFIQAANAALLELRSLKVSGLRDYTRNDDTDIIFHHNDYPIFQTHQGATSLRKPDIVVVSYKTAKGKSGKGKGGKGKGRKGKGGKAKGNDTEEDDKEADDTKENVKKDKDEEDKVNIYIDAASSPAATSNGSMFNRQWSSNASGVLWLVHQRHTR
ncbi:uncharacterized protein EDB91DRAFT_879466 [Suillus paluster]|uniref:uncharacterized protein n=1 Tax=Suillus paluster TaxID=48578 RepID=UPI001B86E0CE|nr:uncharacterized protein EDB91DRAFT_879466 [Suillus paluster]KAG1748447.1 hypothetical protein EDB91DRAFT_879466 [Suillus paluster]